MNYFKHDNMMIEADAPPLVVARDTKLIQTEDGLYSVSPDNLSPWEEVSRVTYLIFKASHEKPLESADRNTQAAMWALNVGSQHILRLGGEYPVDGLRLDHMTTKDAKIEMVSKTQHHFHPKKPKTHASNSSWMSWIIRLRRTEPFIYLGDI